MTEVQRSQRKRKLIRFSLTISSLGTEWVRGRISTTVLQNAKESSVKRKGETLVCVQISLYTSLVLSSLPFVLYKRTNIKAQSS